MKIFDKVFKKQHEEQPSKPSTIKEKEELYKAKIIPIEYYRTTKSDKTTDYVYMISNNNIPLIQLRFGTYSETLAQGLLEYFKEFLNYFLKYNQELNEDDFTFYDRSSYLYNINNFYYNKYEIAHLKTSLFFPLIIDAQLQHYDLITYKEHKKINKNSKTTEMFVQENKDNEFTQEMIIKLLILLSDLNIYTDEIEIDEQKIEYYIQKYKQYFTNKDFNTYNITDMCKFVIPTLIDLDDEHIRFLNNFHPQPTSLFRTYEQIDIMYKLYYIAYYIDNIIDKNVTLQEFTPDKEIMCKDNYKKTDILNTEGLFADSIMTVDKLKNIKHLNNVTVGNINKFLYTIPNYYLHDHFVKLIEMYITEIPTEEETMKFQHIVNEKLSNDTINIDYRNKVIKTIKGFVNDNYHDFLYKKVYTMTNLDDPVFSYKSNIKVSKKLIQYVIENEDKITSDFFISTTFMNSVIFGDYYFFFKEKYDYDTSTEDNDYLMGGYVIDQLSDLIGFESTFELLDTLYENGTKLTLSQWEYYITNIDEYKDLPVSWWLELV